MSYIPCIDRVFPFMLAAWLPTRYASYLHWLRRMLERLGLDRTLAIWQEIYQRYDNELLFEYLGFGQ